jgi:PIN domain nuclease of toxin-antitoxin system
VRLLLDTNVFLWLQTVPERVIDERRLLEDEANDALVSAVTAWEIAIKYALKKLPLPEPPERYVPDAIRALGAEAVAIEHRHALAVADLPRLHRDPFDRLLIAQAIALHATLITTDRRLTAYPADTLLVG